MDLEDITKNQNITFSSYTAYLRVTVEVQKCDISMLFPKEGYIYLC